jgi:hypothetical protein
MSAGYSSAFRKQREPASSAAARGRAPALLLLAGLLTVVCCCLSGNRRRRQSETPVALPQKLQTWEGEGGRPLPEEHPDRDGSWPAGRAPQ